MKKVQLSLLSLALLAFVGCKNETKKAEEEAKEVVEEVVEEVKKEVKTVTIPLEAKSESSVTGNVSFSEKEGVVHMVAKMSGLTAGTHAIHLHEKADCSSADAKSSGGHWNPTFKDHGAWGAETGYHKGDIGNFEVGEDGTGRVEFSTNEWCIGCGDNNKDIMGKAVVVHQGADDFTSQPSGAAGARVSCAGIIE
ncbi:superoxide dismutase family protein [Aureisphaera galaxeae]|uniref:superoxide dismutase family protein n=1 Tax=Aureisphaera galaxeae TaxID=1538023 RepID=UPI0023503F20|nr:superoxide dismutase family protein [Aureisphaera galaxeae]MDC8003572.1 superoxide dismutase family protein [Aureisphaera galaxeae]